MEIGVCQYCKKQFAYRHKGIDQNFCRKDCYNSSVREQKILTTGLEPWQLAIYRTTKKRAEKKCVDFEVSTQDLADAILRANGSCEVTGIQFTKDIPPRGVRRPWFPSVDRIDSSKGYTKDNIRIVCVAANLAMNTWGEDVLFEMAVSMMKDVLSYSTNGKAFTGKYGKKTLGTFSSLSGLVKAKILEANKTKHGL